MSNHEHDNETIEISRRRMMGLAVGVINLGLIGGIVIPMIGFATDPVGKKRKQQWVELMDESMIQPGEVKEVNFSMRVMDGYHEIERKYTVFLRRDEQGLICLDPACTHLGCRINYQSEQHRFFCPCHGGVFDDEGNRVSGPPPKPLERHPVKVENGKILISREA